MSAAGFDQSWLRPFQRNTDRNTRICPLRGEQAEVASEPEQPFCTEHNRVPLHRDPWTFLIGAAVRFRRHCICRKCFVSLRYPIQLKNTLQQAAGFDSHAAKIFNLKMFKFIFWFHICQLYTPIKSFNDFIIRDGVAFLSLKISLPWHGFYWHPFFFLLGGHMQLGL